jgi:protein-S-isoprenylcysteine O-methyltransferase Ste14
MVLLHLVLPITTLIPQPLNLLGLVPMLLGIGLAIVGNNKFTVVGTNINTFDEPDKLVTDGLFKYSRNPMYLGFALVLFGVWFLLGSLSPALIVTFAIVVTDQWYIAFEERMLARKFGLAYTRYKSQTRRWI